MALSERGGAAALVGAVVASWLLLGTSSGPAQTFRSMDYPGAELYERFCAACHGPNGQGDGPVAPSLAAHVPDLTRLAERYGGEFPAEAVAEVVDGRSPVMAHGPRTMPVWGYEFWVEEGADITAEENARELIDRLVEHLASIQVDPDSPRFEAP